MRVCFVQRRVAAVLSVVFFCLAASSHRLVSGVAAHRTRLSDAPPSPPAANSTAQTCSKDGDLQLSGALTSFKITCPDGSQLAPVEVDIPATRAQQLNAYNVTKVYSVASATRASLGKTCDTKKPSTLSDLAPGSTLTPDDNAAPKQAAQEEGQEEEDAGEEAVNATVYTLRLGDPQEDERRFCYMCTPKQKANVAPESACSIFVTVPKKDNAGTTKPPSESGSFSLSASRWPALGVTGCVAGLLVYL